MNKKKSLPIFIIFSIVFIATIFIIAQNIKAMNVLFANRIKPTNTSWLPNPANYPPGKATMWAEAQQTQQAAELLPTHDFQKIYPASVTFDSNAILSQKLSGKLSGYGILGEDDPPMNVQMIDGKKRSPYDLDYVYWYEDTYDSFITVWSGVSNLHPGKGIVYVVIGPRYNPFSEFLVFENPDDTGKLQITGALGERLILKSEKRGIIYFDVPALSYVSSLEEKVPIMPLVSASTPTPLRGTENDAPDYPLEVTDYSSTGTNLSYYTSTIKMITIGFFSIRWFEARYQFH